MVKSRATEQRPLRFHLDRRAQGPGFLAATALGGILAVLAGTQPSYAQTEWTGASSNNWWVASNWAAGVPDSTDAVTIDSISPAPEIDAGPAEANALSIGSSSDGMLIVDDTGSLSVGPTLEVGESETGTLMIIGGGSVDSMFGQIGLYTDSDGTVYLSGDDSTWTVGANIQVGVNGKGQLLIENHGKVSSQNGTLGSNSGAVGTATVTGTNSSWTMSNGLTVGSSGSGSLLIESGGSVSSSTATIGANGFGEVLVTGLGSTWNNGDLNIGRYNTGELTIADGGVVEVSGALTIAQNAGSEGYLMIGGSLGGAGFTSDAAGILDADMVTFGAGHGEILFLHTDNAYDFSVGLSGDGYIGHASGETILSGDSSGFTGILDVVGGTLYANNDLSGADTYVFGPGMATGAGRLGGSGSVGNLEVYTGGILAPGNSVGTLNVGSVIFDAGSIYEVELSDGGFAAGTNNDLLDSSGTVTINGGTVHVTPENGGDDGSTYTPGIYTIVTAAGGVSGAGFDTLTDDYAFLNFTLDYGTANQVNLISSRAGGGTCPAGLTFNENAACGGVLSLGSGSLYNAALGLSNAEAPVALDQLSGEIHASTNTALLEDSRFPRDAAQDRLRMALGGVAADHNTRIEDQVSEHFGLWGQGFGSWRQWDSNGNAAAMDRTIGGFLMGGDALIWDDVRFGVLGGYSHAHFGVNDHMSSGTADTYTLGAYGGSEWDAFTLRGGLAHSWHSLDTSRSVAFSGFSDNLSAAYSGRPLQAWGEAAYSFETGAARFEPFANLAYVNLNTDGFTESGAEFLNLTVDDSDVAELKAGVDVTAWTDISTENGLLQPYLGIGYEHDLLDDKRELDGRLSSGQTVEADSRAAAKSVFNLSGGLRFLADDGLRAEINLSASIGAGGEESFILPQLRIAKTF